MTAAKFLLEHFYFGQLVQGGRPTGQAQLLAASPGVNAKMAEYAVSRVNLPPLIMSPRGSWALVRGKSRHIPFLMVQSQQGNAGQQIEHYIIMPPDVLKSYNGNLSALKSLLQETLPTYETPDAELPLLEIEQGEPRTVEQQIDDILELMMVTNNSTAMIEPLLAAIVQGTQLVIQGAPPELDARVQFVEGLLALLPPSARFGVTFATHSAPTGELDVQIRFLGDGFPPDKTTVFNWATTAVFGVTEQDDYSRFVISQLRLDAELVIQQNMLMTPIAGWRLNQDEKLAVALGYAAKRLRLDESLRNGQPVDKDEVARVLADDPTLTEPLKVLYAQHLIRFSLAMEDMQHAAPVAVLLRNNPELEQSVREQMDAALHEGQGWLIYDTLVDWMSNPLGPEGDLWIKLTHTAALSLLQDLVADQDYDEINRLLVEMQKTSPGVALGRIVPNMVQMLAPLLQQDAHMVENLFLLALKHTDTRNFVALMNTEKFRQRLDPQIKRVWGYIVSEEHEQAHPDVLIRLVRSFPADLQPAVLLRFVEMAVMANHYDLVDTPIVRALARLAVSPDLPLYRERLLSIIRQMTDEVLLYQLEAPGPFCLLQIHLAVGDYHNLAEQMITQSSVLYPGDYQTDYVLMVDDLFSSVSLAPDEVPRALHAIREAGIKAVPFIVASVGCLHDQNGAPELDTIADRVVEQIHHEPRFLEVLPQQTIMKLLAYYSRRQNADGIAEASKLVPLAAEYHGDAGVQMLAEAYKLMSGDERTQQLALHMLRVFVREAEDESFASKSISYFARQLGATTAQPLATSLLMRQFMDHQPLLDYIDSIQLCSNFLLLSSGLYTDSKNLPESRAIVDALNRLSGALSPEQRAQLARSTRALGMSIILLGKQYRSARPRDEKRYLDAVLKGETNPRAVVDIFRIMSGYFSRGRRLQTNITPVQQPLEGYTMLSLEATLTASERLLVAAQRVFPPNQPLKIRPDAIQGEMRSLIRSEPVEADVLREFAIHLQQLADLIIMTEANGDAAAFDDSNLARRIDSGKHQPRSVLEFLRLLHAYFSRPVL